MMLTSIRKSKCQFELPGGLLVVATTDPTDPLLDEFFKYYDYAFILPSEKEERSGFVECLSLNHGNSYAKLASTWGPFREWVLLVRGADGGTIIGGANLICFPLSSGQTSVVISVNLNYLFIEPSQRRRGYLKKILEACQELALRSFEPLQSKEQISLLMFIEQNDPLKLTPAEYAQDSLHAGIDPVDRVRIWQHAGARIIDFPYIQPALSMDQKSDNTLMLSVLGLKKDELDPCLFLQHLERFFGISVLKGRDPDEDSRQQLVKIEAACRDSVSFKVFDPKCWLNSLQKGPPYLLKEDSAKAEGSLRNRLRQMIVEGVHK